MPASTLKQIDCGLFQATFGDPDFESRHGLGGALGDVDRDCSAQNTDKKDANYGISRGIAA